MTDTAVGAAGVGNREIAEVVAATDRRIQAPRPLPHRHSHWRIDEFVGMAVVLAGVVAVTPLRLFALQVSVVVLVVSTLELSALPRYSRWSSLRPVVRVTVWVGAMAFVGLVAGVLSVRDARIALIITGAAMVVPITFRLVRRRRATPITTLLVGDRVSVTHLLVQWQSAGEVLPVGICLAEPDDDIERSPVEIMGVPVLGRYEQAAVVARELGVQRVVVEPGPVLTAYVVRRVGWALEQSHIEMAVASEIHGAVPRRIEPSMIGGRLVMSVRPPHQSPVTQWIKSMADRAIGALLLLLAAPAIGALVILVRRDSRGPGFFTQRRIGRGGRPFTMYKLRTMHLDAEERRAELLALNEGAGLLFKLSDDPRVTRIGRILRRTSLDELPQLINVVRGEMSLIGPRPALPGEVNDYDDWIRRRLTVRPGMTGLWQVSGRSNLPWHRSVRLDLDYVDNWSLLGDLKIAAKTVDAVVSRDGAT